MLLLTNGMGITAQVMPFVAFWSCFWIKKQTLIPLRMHVRWVRAYQFFLFRQFSCTFLYVCFSYKTAEHGKGRHRWKFYEPLCFSIIHRRSYDNVLACFSGKRISPLLEGTANFSAMSYRDKKGKRAIVLVSLRVGCFWAIIKEWIIDVCKCGFVIE